MSTHGDDTHEPRESPHDCHLDRFERNRYFHQKPMFARDFVAEQHYHVDRQDTLAQYLAGEGILDGLETTVVEEDDERLTVTVSEGVALDCCGRLLVVSDETEWTLDDPQRNETDLYLVYGECVTETVPLAGSEGACETECEYNRVLEVVDVVQDPAPGEALEPGDALFEQYKRIPDVDFPDPTTTTLEDVEALFRMAQTFHENGGTLHECGPGDRRVFLGRFTGTGPGAWSRDETVPLGYAYSTDLLYAVLANLLIEPNPHRIGIEVESFTGSSLDETGATLRVQGPDNPDGEVTVVTTDPDVLIGTGGPTGTERLTVAVPGLDDLRTRLDTLEGALREQATRYMRTAFSVVAERFAGTPVATEAADVRMLAVNAINNSPPYGVPGDFADFVGRVLPEAQALSGVLPGIATPDSITRYELALQDLETTHSEYLALSTHSADDSSSAVARMTTALDGLSEAAEWLTAEAEPAVVGVFLGDEGLDLPDLDVVGIPESGGHQFIGMSGAAAGGVGVVDDVVAADITVSNDFATGGYANASDGPVVLAVLDPLVTAVALLAADGTEVTNGALVDSPTVDVTVDWNFDAYEGVVVSVADEDGLDVTDDLRSNGVRIESSGGSITLDTDDIADGTYTVTAEGEDHLDDASRSVTLTVGDEATTISLSSTTVDQGDDVLATITGGPGETKYIQIGRADLYNSSVSNTDVFANTADVTPTSAQDTSAFAGAEVALGDDGSVIVRINTRFLAAGLVDIEVADTFGADSEATAELTVEADLTAQLSSSQIAANVGDGVTVSGTALDQGDNVRIYKIGPRGDVQFQMVDVAGDEFETDFDDITARGTHTFLVIGRGRDGRYGATPDEIRTEISGGVTPSQALEIIRNGYSGTGVDDRIVELTLQAENPSLTIDDFTTDGQVLQDEVTISGTSNREDETTVFVDVLGENENVITSTEVEVGGGSWSTVIDLSDVETGTYTLHANDDETSASLEFDLV